MYLSLPVHALCFLFCRQPVHSDVAQSQKQGESRAGQNPKTALISLNATSQSNQCSGTLGLKKKRSLPATKKKLYGQHGGTLVSTAFTL